MKILISPELKNKLSVLNNSNLVSIHNFISNIQDLKKNDLLSKQNLKISLLEGEIYQAYLPLGKLLFTLGEVNNEDYVVLMDVISIQNSNTAKDNYFASNNPITNRGINPKYNKAINPEYNKAINPKYNTAINPEYNTAINPKYNTAINPKYNITLNLRHNNSINPKYNSSLNPKMNNSLNPRINQSYGGPFLYDINLKQHSFLVKANEKIELIFGQNTNFYGFIVHVNDAIKIEFDTSNNWIGYFIKANDKVWLRYSNNNKWIGLLV